MPKDWRRFGRAHRSSEATGLMVGQTAGMNAGHRNIHTLFRIRRLGFSTLFIGTLMSCVWNQNPFQQWVSVLVRRPLSRPFVLLFWRWLDHRTIGSHWLSASFSLLSVRAAFVSRLVFDALARARCRVGCLHFAIIAVFLSPVTVYHLVTAPSGVTAPGLLEDPTPE